MPFQDVIRRVGWGGETEGVPWHEHGADEISGEFGDIILSGDFFSTNWDGDLPADLGDGRDPTATNGFYFDTSEGAAQFEGDVFLGGELRVDGSVILDGGEFMTDDTAPRVLIRQQSPDLGGVIFERDVSDVGTHGISATDDLLQIVARQIGASDDVAYIQLARDTVSSQPGVLLGAGGSGAGLHLFYTGTAGQPEVKLSSAGVNAILIWPDADAADIEIRGALHQNTDGTESLPSYSFNQDRDTGIYRAGADELGFATGGVHRWLIDSAGYLNGAATTLSPALRSTAGSVTTPSYAFRGNTATGLYTDTGNLNIAVAGVAQAYFRDSTSSAFVLRDGLADIGDQTVLRLARGTGTILQPVGYFSSWLVDPLTGAEAKRDLIELSDSPRFPGLKVIDKIRLFDYERVSTEQREWGFLLNNFEEIDDNLRYLTTDGDNWGYSPSEHAINALQMLALQDLRQRVTMLETELAGFKEAA